MSGDKLGDMILGLWEDDSKRFLENREGKSLLSKMEHDILLNDNDGAFKSMYEKEFKRQIMKMDKVFEQDKENIPLSEKEEKKLWKTVRGGRKRKSRKSRRSKKSKKGRRTRRSK